MKSNARLEQEIKTVADIWNSREVLKVDSAESRIASAIYHTLRWARGLRETEPAQILRNKWKEVREANVPREANESLTRGAPSPTACSNPKGV